MYICLSVCLARVGLEVQSICMYAGLARVGLAVQSMDNMYVCRLLTEHDSICVCGCECICVYMNMHLWVRSCFEHVYVLCICIHGYVNVRVHSYMRAH